MTRPTLLVGMPRPVTRQHAQDLQTRLEERMPHVEVVLVHGTDGMLLIDPPETRTAVEVRLDGRTLASTRLRQDALAVDDEVSDSGVVAERDRDGRGDPGHDAGLGGASQPEAGLALEHGGLNAQGDLTDFLVGAVGQAAEAGDVDVRHETSSRLGAGAGTPASARTVEEPSDGTGEVASSPEPVPSGQGHRLPGAILGRRDREPIGFGAVVVDTDLTRWVAAPHRGDVDADGGWWWNDQDEPMRWGHLVESGPVVLVTPGVNR